MARVLERDPPRAPVGERPADDALALRVPGRDDHALRLGDDAAHPAEVLGEGRAQRLDPARVAVAELGVGDLPTASRSERSQAARGKLGDVRGTRAEVEAGSAGGRRRSDAAGLAARAASETRGRAPWRRTR